MAALLRQAQSEGTFGTVLAKGSSESGAIYIARYDPKTRQYNVFDPAPQSETDDDAPPIGGRFFSPRRDTYAEAELSALIERERRFDSDCWWLELEVNPEQLMRWISVLDQ